MMVHETRVFVLIMRNNLSFKMLIFPPISVGTLVCFQTVVATLVTRKIKYQKWQIFRVSILNNSINLISGRVHS